VAFSETERILASADLRETWKYDVLVVDYGAFSIVWRDFPVQQKTGPRAAAGVVKTGSLRRNVMPLLGLVTLHSRT
jgi:hypothetical protein